MSGLDASGLSPYYLSASPLLQAITQPYTGGPGTAYQPNYDLFWLNQPSASWPGTASPGGSVSIQGAGVSDWSQLSPEELAAEAAPYIQHLRNITGPEQTPEQFAESIAPYIEQQIAPQLEQLRAQQAQQLTPEQVNAIVAQQMAPQMQELQGMLGSMPTGVTADQVQGMLANLPQQGVTAEQVQNMLSLLPTAPTSAQVAQEITPYIEQQIMPYLSEIQGMLGNQQQAPITSPVENFVLATPAPAPASEPAAPPPVANQYTPPVIAPPILAVPETPKGKKKETPVETMVERIASKNNRMPTMRLWRR